MTHFRSETELPSTRVSRELLKSLENYIIERVRVYAEGVKEGHRDNIQGLKITITDSFGAETINTINQFIPTKFPDSTESIEVSYSAPWRTEFKRLDVIIKFNKERRHSTICISYEGTNSREFCHGWVSGIRECLKPHVTYNNFFHPRFIPQAVAYTIFLFAVIFMWSKDMSTLSPLRVLGLGGVTFFLWMYLVAWPWFKPYTVFDSPQADNKETWWNYHWRAICLFAGVIGIGSWFRDHIVGFLARVGWCLHK